MSQCKDCKKIEFSPIGRLSGFCKYLKDYVKASQDGCERFVERDTPVKVKTTRKKKAVK